MTDQEDGNNGGSDESSSKTPESHHPEGHQEGPESFVHNSEPSTGQTLLHGEEGHESHNENGPIEQPARSWHQNLRQSFGATAQRAMDKIRGFSFRSPRSQIMSGDPDAVRGQGEGTLSSLRRMELLNTAEWLSKSLQNRGYAFYGKLLTVVLCTYFLADVTAMMAGKFIPEPPVNRFGRFQEARRQMQDYNAIFTRNLFNRQGLIPGEENGGGFDLGGAPVRTTLPFNLVGTLILRDELRSIATIEDKSANMVYPVRIDEEIPSKARIVKIEPRRVIFVNTQSGRREYVDLPDEPTVNARISVPTASKGSGIEQVATGQFNIDRKEVDKAMADFNNILTQARAVPNIENGVPNGYKLFQIVPNSIYDKLGLKNGDVITGVDGQPINDPAKAFELLGKLREGASHLDLQVKRDGVSTPFSYDIH